jgi:hypothetical protein
MNTGLTIAPGNVQSDESIVMQTEVWDFKTMLKISLVALFMLSLATLSVAASYMPVPAGL